MTRTEFQAILRYERARRGNPSWAAIAAELGVQIHTINRWMVDGSKRSARPIDPYRMLGIVTTLRDWPKTP